MTSTPNITAIPNAEDKISDRAFLVDSRQKTITKLQKKIKVEEGSEVEIKVEEGTETTEAEPETPKKKKKKRKSGNNPICFYFSSIVRSR